MGLMAAIALICSMFHFPLLPGATFLEFEVHDIPVLIAAFAFGPIPGFIVGVVSILLHDMIIGMASGPYGMIMHIIADAAFALVAGFFYQRLKTKRNAVLALIIGGLCMTAAMVPANLFITPYFMGAPVSAVVAMLPTVIVPFNLLKALIDGVVVFFLYKRLSPFLHRY
jgi:riboflavin transporter FmnP